MHLTSRAFLIGFASILAACSSESDKSSLWNRMNFGEGHSYIGMGGVYDLNNRLPVMTLADLDSLVALADSPKPDEASYAPEKSADKRVQSKATVWIKRRWSSKESFVGVSGIFDLKGLVPGMSSSEMTRMLPSLVCVKSPIVLKTLEEKPYWTPAHSKIYSEWSDTTCFTPNSNSMTFANEPAFYEILLKNDKIVSIQVGFGRDVRDKVIQGIGLKFKLDKPSIGYTTLEIAMSLGLKDEKANHLLLRNGQVTTVLTLTSPELVEKAVVFEKTEKLRQAGVTDM